MAHCICAACLASSSGRLPCRSVEPPLTPNPLACGSLDVLHPNAAGADIGSDFHVVAVAPPGTDCVEVRLLRRPCTADLHAHGRLAEAAPRRYRRHGGHRRVLDCVVRPARSQGVPGSPGGPPPDPTGPGPPQSDTQDAQWIRRLHSLGLLSGASDPTRASACCAVTCANAPGWSPSVAGPSSTCRRPWSRSTSN